MNAFVFFFFVFYSRNEHLLNFVLEFKLNVVLVFASLYIASIGIRVS